ncbi:hypothetical protein QFC21_002733 [Naganishia friedmannii]|uniref:Uncharacterized protein n=1 Tax=Naganishia friedmannii TaxID=89922 RepID=A0ACC2VT87_9TREE|nr:hypothetical protein QFC21_002733 [Naganishia friedmannii]
MSKLPPLRNEITRSATTNLEQESTRASFAPSRNPQSRSDTSSRLHNHHASYDAGEDDERPLRYSRSSAASATTDTCRQPQHHTAQNKDRVSLGERLGEDVLCKSLIVPLIATSFVTGDGRESVPFASLRPSCDGRESVSPMERGPSVNA